MNRKKEIRKRTFVIFFNDICSFFNAKDALLKKGVNKIGIDNLSTLSLPTKDKVCYIITIHTKNTIYLKTINSYIENGTVLTTNDSIEDLMNCIHNSIENNFCTVYSLGNKE
ncbi:MAG: hypothetical protein ACLSVX_12650 [Massilimicrobiota timonensis]